MPNKKVILYNKTLKQSIHIYVPENIDTNNLVSYLQDIVFSPTKWEVKHTNSFDWKDFLGLSYAKE